MSLSQSGILMSIANLRTTLTMMMLMRMTILGNLHHRMNVYVLMRKLCTLIM
jgi:hypothetical protein